MERIAEVTENITIREKVMFLLLVGGIIFSGVGWYKSNDKEAIRYFYKWGANTPVTKTRILGVGIYGSKLIQKKNGFKIAVTALLYDGLTDAMDATGLQKSNLFDIQNGDIEIKIPVDDEFIDLLKKGKRHTNYTLLLVPKGISLDQFTTLRQAHSLGIQSLQIVAGPP